MTFHTLPTNTAWVGAILTLASGCMVSPHHGEIFANRTTVVDFELYATKASAPITIDCAPGYYDPWQSSAITFTSGTSPITYGGETVYFAGGNRTIPSSCWSSYTIHGYYMTRLRPRQEGYAMRVYDEDGLDCLFGKIGEGIGPITAGNACGMKFSNSNNYSDLIYVHAQN